MEAKTSYWCPYDDSPFNGIPNIAVSFNAVIIYGFKETHEMYWKAEEIFEDLTNGEEYFDESEFDTNYRHLTNYFTDKDSIVGIEITRCELPLAVEFNKEFLYNFEQTEEFLKFKNEASKYYDLTNIECVPYLCLELLN